MKENQNIEYKQSWRDDYLKWICGFASTKQELFSQIEQVMNLLLTKYTKSLISYEGLQRIENYPVPEAALREILLNAVVHKDYACSAPVQISVYHDKILFWNPGVLPDGWTEDTLIRKHASQPYNPDIANVFFRSGMIEA
jgi:ATP-dependent DNA helicase RecG